MFTALKPLADMEMDAIPKNANINERINRTTIKTTIVIKLTPI